jgi:hypothetical protein
MVTWLNLTPGVRLARSSRSVRWTIVGILIGACFVLAFIL